MVAEADYLVLVLPDVHAALAGTSRGTIAQEFLNARGTVNFPRIEIAVSIGGNGVWPMETAGLPAARSESGDLVVVGAVEYVDRVVSQIGHIQTGLLRIG